MSHHHNNKRKSCHTEILAQYVSEEYEHAERVHIDYGFGCAFPAKHSVVIRFIDPNSKGEKLILPVCDEHFNRIHDHPLLDPCSWFDSEAPIRISFRRNRL